MHEQMYTFALDHDQELVNLRAIQQGKPTKVKAERVGKGSGEPKEAVIETTNVFVDGKNRKAKIYDRSLLKSGHSIPGPAIVTEMDSTTLILPDHIGKVDGFGNILITPSKGIKKSSSSSRPSKRKAAKKKSPKRKVAKKKVAKKKVAKKKVAKKKSPKRKAASKKSKKSKSRKR